MRTPRGTKTRGLRPKELAWELGVAVAFGLAAIGIFAALWSPPSSDAGPQQVFIGSLDPALADANTISVHVKTTGSMREVIGGPVIDVQIPKGGTVAALDNRLTDRYPVLEPYAMVALNGGMLPLSLELADGQTVELMAPHSAGLTFLGKPLPTQAR